MTKANQTTMFITTIGLLVTAAVGVVGARDRKYPVEPAQDRLLYIRSGSLITKVALSYDALLADVYWIRAIQQYGYDRLHPEAPQRHASLYPLLDLTTSLDPRFTVAYRFGAIFLSEPEPGGAGRPEQAIALLEKGVSVSPDKWEYYHDVGFVYYWHLHNYQKAAEWFSRGADRPRAPWWLKTYSAVMLTKGGNREASRFMWRNILQSATNDWMKQNAASRLRQLDAMDQIDSLSRVVAEFSRRTGRPPVGWNELVQTRLLRGVPVDPSGTPYELDAAGEVMVSVSSVLYPLPTEPLASPELQSGSPIAR
jgi:tetratricopeptide (TPR) repeat protein